MTDIIPTQNEGIEVAFLDGPTQLIPGADGCRRPRRSWASSSGSAPAGSAWSSWWPSSPTCSRCPIPTTRTSPPPRTARPAWGHLLGTDDLNRDIFSRLLYGARVSLVVGFGGALIGMILGGHPGHVLGLPAGPVGHLPQHDLLRRAGLPGPGGGHRHRRVLGPPALEDHPGHRRVQRPPDLPGHPGLHPVLRHPGLRDGRQGPGGQRPPHPGPGAAARTSCPPSCRSG